MANPLKIKVSSGNAANSTNFTGLQEMSNAEMDYISHKILVNFATEANSSQSFVGDLNTISIGTSIGSFEDIRRTESIGTHPAVGTTNSVKQHFLKIYHQHQKLV